MLDAKKIDAALAGVERFKSRVDRYADANTVVHLSWVRKNAFGGQTYGTWCNRMRMGEGGMNLTESPNDVTCSFCRKKIEQRGLPKVRSDAEEQKESAAREHKETTHNKETRQSTDGSKHIVETKQSSEPQKEDKPDPAAEGEAKAKSGESKAAVHALETKIAQDKKNERYEDSQMKPDPNLDHGKMDRMVNTTEKLVSRMDAYEARNKADDYGHPVASGFRTQEQEPRSDDTMTKEEIHHTIDKHQRDEKEDDEESDARGGDNPRKDKK